MFDFQNEERKESTGSKVDWDARREYMVANCGTADASESTIAIISSIVDCGLQHQDDAKMEFNGNAADEAKVLADEREKYNREPTQYFETLEDEKTGAMKRYKRWPVEPVRSYAVFVDIPGIMLDQGQFFGEEPGTFRPLRLMLNGEWNEAGAGKIVNKRGYVIREKKHDTKDGVKYALAKTNTLHKLAEATDCLNEYGLFKPNMLGSLLGKAVLVDYRVFQTVSNGKTYLNEKVSLQGKVPSMMKAMIPVLDKQYITGVAFKGEQNEEILKQLRQSVINTMKLATDFKGGTLEAALIKIGKVKADDGAPQAQQKAPEPQVAPQVKEAPKQQAPQPAPDFDAFDDDLPF